MKYFSRLRNDSQRRLTDKEGKKRTYTVQYISSALFIFFGVFLPIKYLVLFLSEGVGQFFLAYNNQRGFKKNDTVIKYLDSNALGYLATLSFSITNLARFYELSDVAFVVTGLIGLVYLGIYFKLKHPDEVGFVWLTGTALTSGIYSLYMFEEIIFGVVQVIYGTLLIFSVLFLKPWVAEVFNTILWVLLAISLLIV